MAQSTTFDNISLEAQCPVCAEFSRHIHSRYERTVADLPCMGRPMRLLLRVRKFFCRNDSCQRSIFTERLPRVVAPWGRRTLRLVHAQRQVGLGLGGEAGTRIATGLGMAGSPDTLLRLVRAGTLAKLPTPRVLGVDDWAQRRCHTYGTILVDLEAHRVVDLLPDRSSDTLAKWLQEHPGVEVIARDRAGGYADGASRGAPEAIQVADRFHLLQNLRQTIERMLDRNPASLRAANAKPAISANPCNKPQVEAMDVSESTIPATLERQEALAPSPTDTASVSEGRRAQRQEQYKQVVVLHQQGMTSRAIARQLRMSPNTVRRYLGAGSFPERAQARKTRSVLDPFKHYLYQQLAAGQDNAMQLWREMSTAKIFTHPMGK